MRTPTMRNKRTVQPMNTSFLSRVINRIRLPLVIAAGLVLLTASFTGGCREEVTGIVTQCLAPTVIRTSPANGGTNETLNKNPRTVRTVRNSRSDKSAKVTAVKIITATFSTPMDARTINPLTFRMNQGATVIAGTVSYTDTTAVFIVPDGLSPNLTYTCILTTGVRDLAGTSLASNYTWSFSTIAAGTPTLVSPLNGALNQATSPTLDWNTVAGASSYRLQVSTNNGFTSTVYDDSTRTNTSQVVSGLSAGTTYFWRVNSKISGGTSSYSTVWSFTTVTAGTPIPLSPLDGSVNQSTSPTFIWGGVSGAGSYHLQVSLDPGFLTTVYNDSTLISTSRIVSDLTVGTTYYWRVRSKISGGTSAYSSAWSFTTIAVPASPVPIAPADLAINIATSPLFRWNASAGAATYRLQVSTNSSFTSIVFDTAGMTNTSKIVLNLTEGTIYYWRINATNAAGTSIFTARSFTTITAGTPTLIAPIDGALQQSVNPTLVWNNVSGAVTYRLQASTVNTFATTVYDDSTLTGTSQSLTALAVGTTYFWRVNSKNASGTSEYSDVWSFTTITLPAIPVLVSPLTGATNQPVNPMLTWNSVTGATSYRLQVSTDNTFATTFYNDSTRTSTSQQIATLAVGTTYFWRVNAKNAAGTSSYSVVRSFTTIVVPAAPVLFAPSDALINQAVNPSLIWNSVPGAATYRLQVSTINTFATTIYDDSTRTSTSQQVSGLNVGTTYFWRVNAKNAAGASSYSTIWSFKTIVVPAAPILVAPLDLAVNQSASPVLIWNSVAGAATYRLQVSTVNTFATTVYNDSTRTNTSQSVTGLAVGTTYFWRVNTKNVAGTSVYSTVWSFTTSAAPLAPVLIAPINLAVNQSVNPNLSWNASVGAATYRVQVSTLNTFATTVFNDSTVTGTSQPLTGLNPGTTYFWRVNAKNVAGTSPYSTRSFTTAATIPLPPVLSAPADASIDIKLNPTLIWFSSVGATSYRLQLDTSQAFAAPVLDDSTITILQQPLVGLKTNTTYYWRMNAKNSGGTSAYSTIWRFTTGTGLAPGAVPLLTVGTFGIMATSAVTNTGNSIVNGDVSLDPGTSITGFTFSTSPGPGVVNGTVHINDLISAKARQDLLAAYNFAKGKPVGTTIGAGADLGALYPLGIPPGTYTSGSTMLVSTDLVLDGGGNADAVWVFQIGSSLTTGANVTLTGGAQAKNVFWVPTDDATIGVGTIFHGTIVSGRDVTAVTGSTINGRILAGAITAGTIALQTATVNVPLP